jgi:hypothetical protein
MKQRFPFLAPVLAILVAVALFWFRPGKQSVAPRRIPLTKAEAIALYGEPEQGWRAVKPNEFSSASTVRGGIWLKANPAGDSRIVFLDAEDRVTRQAYFGSLVQHKRWFKDMWREGAEW